MSVTQVNERLAALTAAGTSVWLDQIRRGMIESGELARMVEEDSLHGVTSNPAIFEKAILGSPDYDADIAAAARDGLSAREVYRRLAVRDVQLAADVLRGVYDSTGGADGYVSLEVAPRLAHDTEGTIEQARMYWGLVDRPNLMIKIPATPEGIPAIETALYEGLNVNVTLLFAVSAYEDVMGAFLRAMERRHAEGKPLDRHSVASFFVSRVDTEVDKRLAAAGREDLQGRAGLANARAAYRAFQDVFGGAEFAALRDAGCPVQRPLWASTGVKNPAYPDTLYVYGLVAPDTVNTMPLPTLQAAAGAGEVIGATAAEDPSGDLAALAEAGIDLDDVTDKLLRDGIEAFVVPMNKLIAGIEAKREAIVTGRPASFEADLPADAEQPVAARLAKARADDVVRGVWRKDGALWAPPGTPEVEDRLGWLDDRRQAARGPALDPGLRRAGARGRVHRRGAARDGRVEPRARGVPPLQPAGRGRAAPARARLDRAAADPGGRRRDRRRHHAVHRLLEVRRDDRAERADGVLPRAPARPGALRRRDRPGHVDAPARRARGVPPRVPVRPGDRRPLLGALAVRHRAGGARRASTCTRCSRAGRSRPRTASCRRATPACGSAPRSASWRCAGATSSRSWSTRR